MGTRCTLGAMKEMLVLETSAETTEMVQTTTEAMMIDTIGRAMQLQLTIQIHHAFFFAFDYNLLQTRQHSAGFCFCRVSQMYILCIMS